MAESQFPLNSRVKIYILRPNGNWMDHSVGFFMLVKEDPQTVYLRVVQDTSFQSEGSTELRDKLVQDGALNNGEYVWEINLRLSTQVKYDVQGENIMSWYEPSVQEEIALSFKETSFLKEIYQQIEVFQGKKLSTHFRFDEVEAHPVVMPSHQNLDTLQTQIQEHPETFIQGLTNSPQFFEQLKKIFDEAEEAQHEHTLEALYHIFRCLIYLRNENILLLLMNDQNYMVTFGVLEQQVADQDDNQGRQRVSYRLFLSEFCKFHTIFDGLDDSMVSAINVNYRLTYLKETVMGYYLFQEDPTYIVINNVIQSNNYIIVSTLLNKHLTQFIQLLQKLPQDVLKVSSFLSEFYGVFSRVPQHYEFKNQLIELSRQSNLLYLLNVALRDVLNSQELELEQSQFVCQTLLQFQLLFMNIEVKGFIDFLLESSTTGQLFWGNLYTMVFSDQLAIHPIVCDTLSTICPANQQVEKNMVRPQLVQFLNRCKGNLGQSASTAIAVYEQMLRCYGSHLPVCSEEYLQLCGPLLDYLEPHGIKMNIITSVKFFRFMVKLDEKDVNRYLKEKGYADKFLLFSITRKQEGVLEGLLRETVMAITKNVTISQYMVNKIHADDPIRKSTLFGMLFKEFTYVSGSQSLPPPASPSAKLLSQGSIDHKMFDELHKEDEEEEAHYPQPQTEDFREKRALLISRLIRKPQIDEEEEDAHGFFSDKHEAPQLDISLDIITKKVKPSD